MMSINLAGILLIGLIIWWFWLYTPVGVRADKNELLILVKDGIYQPARIEVEANKETYLKFLRQDKSPCAEMLLIPDIDLSVSLPLDKVEVVKVPPLQTGEYPFHCQMQMYRGDLIVKNRE